MDLEKEFGLEHLLFKERTMYLISVSEDLKPSSQKHPYRGKR